MMQPRERTLPSPHDTWCVHLIALPFPSCSHLLTTTNMSFISVILSLQKVLYKWNHTVYNLWVKVAQSCPTLQPHGLYSPWHSPGQNTGVDSLSLLQGIFPTQGLNPGLPHYRQILYQVSLKGSPRILEWVKVKVKSLSRVRLFATLWTVPGSSVRGILQARILQWVAFSFSRGSSWPRDQTQVSCIASGFLTSWATREA